MVLMIQLSNEYLTVTINEFGAEIQSIIDRKTQHEFIWQADPTYWKRHAPVLFPIIGRLHEQRYHYEENQYVLGAHGFARDSLFEVMEQSATSVTLVLTDSETTREVYPFSFRLAIQISLEDQQVTVKHDVTNTSLTSPLYYSIGGHPAFNVLHDHHDEYQGVRVLIEQQGEIDHIPLTHDGYVKMSEVMKDVPVNKLLQHQDFANDALIYRLSEDARIVLEDTRVKVDMTTHKMPYLGIWSPYPVKAPFVCLEPWAGLPDDWQHQGDFVQKVAIQSLAPEHTQVHAYHVTLILKSSN